MKLRPITRKLVLTLSLGLALITAINSFAPETSAMIMPYPPTIDRMQQSADTIIKARVVSLAPARYAPLDNEFWQIYRAKLKVITCFKGKPENKEIDFFYRSNNTLADTSKIYCDIGPESRAHFNLRPDYSYIFFAKGTGDSLSQLSSNYTLRPWEGFIACADNKKSTAKTVKEAIWNELKAQLENPAQAREAIMTLLELSCQEKVGTIGSDDFQRSEVLETIFGHGKEPPKNCQQGDNLKQIIKAIGSQSPFSRPDTRTRYLWSKATQPNSSWSPWTTKNNLALKPALPFLIKIIEKNNATELTALSILSLGSCQSDKETAKLISDKLPHWLASPSEEIKAASVILSSDYPQFTTPPLLLKALNDQSPKVRAAAAYQAGITQLTNSEVVAKLASLLQDNTPEVQAAAGLSLLAYPSSNKQIRAILNAHIKNKTFGPAFTNRLAQTDAAAYRDQLLEHSLSEASTKPDYYTGATIAFQNGLGCDPHTLCFNSLLQYLDALSSAEIERPEYKKYLEGIEKVAAKDSSITGKTYALLLSHRLSAQAEAFKKQAYKLQPSLPAVVFEQAENELRCGSLKYK